MKPLLSVICALSLSLMSVADANAAPNKDVHPKNSSRHLFQPDSSYSKNHLIIKFRDPVNNQQKEDIFKTYGAIETDELQTGGFSRLAFPVHTDLMKTANILKKDSRIKDVQLNYLVKASYIPSDSGYRKQWNVPMMHAEQAWDTTRGSSDIKVSVIDGGMQVTHPEFQGRIITPHNAVTGTKTIPADEHGTHVAGIIGAAVNKSGTVGIAPGVKIMPVNVFTGNDSSDYDIADAIIHSVKAGADIINLSLTMSDYSSIMDYAVKYASSHGVFITAAAGNDHTSKLCYPAALKSVVGVSAIDLEKHAAPFSNYGTYIDFTAPGTDIYSTMPHSSYGYLSGTSMASPAIAGAAAMILSKNPFIKPDDVISILKKSSADLGEKGWDKYFGYGLPDTNQALINTPSPVSSLKLSGSTLNENGKNTISVLFSAQKLTKASLYVTNQNHKVVSILTRNKTLSDAPLSFTWNGKLSSGAFAPQGRYKMTARVTNGKHTLFKSSYVTIKDSVIPSVSVSSKIPAFSPASKKTLLVPIEVNKNTSLTAAVTDKTGKTVKTLLLKKDLNGGKNSLKWDGKDSKGGMVPDGSYNLALSAKDAAGRVSAPVSLKLIADSTPPVVTLKSAHVFKSSGSSRISAKIGLKEKVKASVYIINSKNQTVETLISGKSLPQGISTAGWDGKLASNASALNGNYRFMVKAADDAGNKRLITSSPFKLVNTKSQ
ncbi:S8 family serine peptidase [Peribacillus sp. B-H-3]|uniref:S8 family serine peptidase n=1 Tax=Peribacillus sp. B-H-3 TaxID=3400420 RepID=UPI003B01E2BA